MPKHRSLNSQNSGVWEKEWLIFIAHIKANIFLLCHWGCRMRVESEWTRRLTYYYTEQVTFVGVVNDREQIVRVYFGESIQSDK